MKFIGQHVAFAVMYVLSVWVLASAVRIELLNVAAGYYLPRRDDGGKWRISREQTPRDQLRGLVTKVGLPQYFLAPALISLSTFCFAMAAGRSPHLLAGTSIAIGLVSWLLAFYREYFSSLGW